MPDPVAAIAQVEDALAAQIAAYGPLAGYSVRTDGSDDIAIDTAESGDVINIYTTGYQVPQSDEQHSTRHVASIEVEVVGTTPDAGTISRATHVALAHVVAAVAADRTLGALIEDIQEIDVAPAGANGKDVGATSIKFEAVFYTSRSDWFTII